MYRDLKASNLVLNEIGQVKLLDFGLSKKVEKKKKRNSFCGTLHAMAPEFFFKRSYSFEVDYFSLGVLAYELTYLRPPFGYKTSKEEYKKIYDD